MSQFSKLSTDSQIINIFSGLFRREIPAYPLKKKEFVI